MQRFIKYVQGGDKVTCTNNTDTNIFGVGGWTNIIDEHNFFILIGSFFCMLSLCAKLQTCITHFSCDRRKSKSIPTLNA